MKKKDQIWTVLLHVFFILLFVAIPYFTISAQKIEISNGRHPKVLHPESVWQVHAIIIDRTDKRWGLSTTHHGLGGVLVDLHTGRFASWWQLLLMDVIAVVLLLSVLTGIVLGIIWASRTRH